MDKFVREHRYFVLKHKDINKGLTSTEQDILLALEDKVKEHRRKRTFVELQGVFIEQDWPEYEVIWNMIKKRMTEPNELKKIFIGAPIMVLVSDSYILYNYHKGVSRNLSRLPTVEEAPRNMWLAPWLEMPDDLHTLNVLYRFSVDKFYSNLSVHEINWDEVEAVMIMKDLDN